MRHVTSTDNAIVKRVRALAHDARTRNVEQRTVIEGEHLCRAWLDHARAPELAVVDAEALGDAEVALCVRRLTALGVEQVGVPAKLMRSIVSTETAVPLVCVVPIEIGRFERCVGADCVALDGVQDPGNVGTILRTAAAAGVTGILLRPGTASAWSPKALRAAMGAHPALEIVEVDDLASALRKLGASSLGTAGDAAHSVYQRDLRSPVAWVFGSEGAGLSSQVRAALDECVSIPQQPAVESLNVASAAAVCLFEMRRQRLTG